MAYMVPEKLPYNASMGEKKTFALLQNLPDSCIVYYEPIISNRYPDFIVILPTVGVLVIEVKGWRNTEIERISNEEAQVNNANEKHPRRQAREYMFRLMDTCKESGLCSDLIHQSGQYEGKFKIPFAHMVVLSNMDSAQLKHSLVGDLTPFFPPENTITRNRLTELLDCPIPENQLVEYFRGFFELQWPVSLSPLQIDELRAVIHPEITIEVPPYGFTTTPYVVDKEGEQNEISLPDAPSEPQILKILDLEQEKEARRIGSGHRLLWGVAGSGKTVLLISRAKYLAQENPEARILVTCYNITLAAYLQHAFENYPTIEAINFHALAKRLWKVTYKKGESNEDFANRLLDEVKSRDVKPIYDMILVDEAQDFDPSWFQSLLSLLKEREEGDLVIVGDGTQGIYKSRKITWKSLGIQAQGRTTYFRRNYRNSKEIISLAANFNHVPTNTTGEEATVEAVCLNPDSAVRSSGIKPVLVSGTPGGIGDTVLKIVSDLLAGEFNGYKLKTPLLPGEIAILYPTLTNGIKSTFFFILNGLKSRDIPVLWASDPYRKTLVCSPDLKLMPIYSAKGLQYKAVILLGADMMPRNDEISTPEADERLMYVALTRPEDYLVITDCGNKSEFIDRFKRAQEKGILEILK